MEHNLEVCLTPELLHLYSVEGKSVVIVDILRATSCMTAGIGSGVTAILPFDDLEACRAMRDHGYVIAGERGGEMVQGFDIGNSPFSYMEPALAGKKVAVTTTNGTRAIQMSTKAGEILIGSFLNISALTAYLASNRRQVLILCAGWKGMINLEDTLFAGALSNRLTDAGFRSSDDAVLVSGRLYRKFEGRLGEALADSSHVQRLRGLGISEDIDYCLRLDEFNVVPGLKEGEIVNLL